MKNKILSLILTSVFSLLLSVSANAITLPGTGGGGKTDELKLKFTKIFFESSLEYMEAQAHLFDALEMNDEAAKTRKSIDFVKMIKIKRVKD